jgi:hypothetical protein
VGGGGRWGGNPPHGFNKTKLRGRETAAEWVVAMGCGNGVRRFGIRDELWLSFATWGEVVYKYEPS